jgi:transposase
MGLHPSPVPPVPEETARVAKLAFRRGNLCLRLRDEFETFFTDEALADLFAVEGRPAEAPWRLAVVTLLQFAEGLSDRQAAEAVRARIDWKYLLSLELTHPGFDYSLLCEFRGRLLSGSAELLLFEALLTRFGERGLVKARGTQRTDSTHVLSAVRTLHRLELVAETMRHALNTLAAEAPDWLGSQAELTASWPAWSARYGRRIEEFRLPKGRAEREALASTIGEDGFLLLEALLSPATPSPVCALAAVQTLRAVWLQQYYRQEPAGPGEGGVRFRTGEELPPAARLIQSPYDPEARYCTHGSAGWVGYKTHLTETCDPDTPSLITDVRTTAATQPDQGSLPEIHAALKQRNLLPAQHLVDSGYVEAESLATSPAQYQVEVIGPPQPDSSWQARAKEGFSAADFGVDFARQVATCPGGKQSVRWREKPERGATVIAIDFARPDCQACPLRERCTRCADHGRRLTVRWEAAHQALQAARKQASSEAFRRSYARRAGVEGTHSQRVRRCGLRRSRYVGQAKTHLQDVLTAAGLNLVRVGYWLLEQKRAHTRSDPFRRWVAAVA